MEGFINPAEFLRVHLKLAPGMKVADFGSGSGHFTIPAAYYVGEHGEVVAIDVLEEHLRLIQKLARDRNLFHVRTVRANLEKPRASGLKDASRDVVLLVNILFQNKDKHAILKEARRVLKPQGRALIVDRNPSGILTPENSFSVGQDEMSRILKKEGFGCSGAIMPDPHHYAFVCRRKS